MSFSVLWDIFSGRVGAHYCVKSLLFLKSPDNVKKYLTSIHQIIFPEGDQSKKERWASYPSAKGTQTVFPIEQKDLTSKVFITQQAEKLSFDISRFIEFLGGYAKVDEDIKPVMLHYALIYLLDFYTRTWLKYGQNWGHGLQLKIHGKASYLDKFLVKTEKNGIFPRAVDAFYFRFQPSLFSLNETSGIGYTVSPFRGNTISERIGKMKYTETQKVRLTVLANSYERLGKIVGDVSKSNHILLGYVVLFAMSSISRYYAEDWFKILGNRDLKSKFEILQNDFIHEWIPEILGQTILRKGLEEELKISNE